jgi:translation initiation factor 5
MEILKKDVMSTCNACGSKRKLDTLHKAGKQLIKDIPNFYKLNPEFKGKVSNVKLDTEESKIEGKAGKSKKQKAQDDEDEQVEKKTKKDKIDDIIEKGGDINILDSRKLELNSDDINEAIGQLDELVTEKPDITAEEILKKARNIQVGINITADYKYVIVMCGVFNPKRTLINHLAKY